MVEEALLLLWTLDKNLGDFKCKVLLMWMNGRCAAIIISFMKYFKNELIPNCTRIPIFSSEFVHR